MDPVPAVSPSHPIPNSFAPYPQCFFLADPFALHTHGLHL